MRADYARNPEKYRQRQKQWTADHPGYRREKATQAMREWRTQNREKSNASARASMKKWRDTHLEEAKQRDYNNPWKKTEACKDKAQNRARKHYLKNIEKVNQRAKAWIKAHPEYRSVANSARRAVELAAEGSYTLADINRLYKNQNGCCNGCRRAFPATGKHRYHVDHIIPLKPKRGQKAGSNGPENLQLLCRSCNSSKHNMSMEEWLKRRAISF